VEEVEVVEAKVIKTGPTVVEIHLDLLGGWKLEKYTLYEAADAIKDGARKIEPNYPETAELLRQLSRTLVAAVYSQDQIEKVKRK
jgi:hypothetical protein